MKLVTGNNKKKLFSRFSILIFFIGFSMSRAVLFNCIYEDFDWEFIGKVYTCKPQISYTESSLEVTGDHISGKSDIDVEGLLMGIEPMTKLPESLENFFPNLKGLSIEASNLGSILASDLQFPNLNYLSIGNSKITNLDDDLFTNNPKLKYIDFSNNPIENIGHDLLNGLDELEQASFLNNECVNLEAKTPEEVKELKRQLMESCPPVGFEPTTTIVSELTTESKATETTTETTVSITSTTHISSSTTSEASAPKEAIAIMNIFYFLFILTFIFVMVCLVYDRYHKIRNKENNPILKVYIRKVGINI
jgi:hypothetical protein